MSNPAAVASPQKRARAGAAAEEETVAEMLGVACKGMKSKYENWENIMSTTLCDITVIDFAGLDSYPGRIHRRRQGTVHQDSGGQDLDRECSAQDAPVEGNGDPVEIQLFKEGPYEPWLSN